MNAFAEFKTKLIRFGLEYFGLFYGVYEGVIVSNDDPERRGRLQIICPAVWGTDKNVKTWVSPRGMFAGKGIGFHAIPENGDTVYVTFKYGNPDYPLWEYGWFIKDGAIEEAGKGVYVMATAKGHIWVVDDNNDTVYFTVKGGKTVEITKTKVNIGKKGGTMEPAVLADKLESFLKEYTLDIGNLGGIVTSTGITSTINTSPGYAAFKLKWETKWKDFKSQVVNLE